MTFGNKKTFCLFEKEEELLEEFQEEDELWKEKDEEGERSKSDDLIKIYFKEVFMHKLLTKEDEVRIGRTIEENEKIILREALNYYPQTAKFFRLINQCERNNKFPIIFKDYEDLEKKPEEQEEWLKELKDAIHCVLEEENKQENIEKIINLVYRVRPTKFLLDEIACEILETYEKFKEFERFKENLKKNFNIEESEMQKIISVDGNRDKLGEFVQKFSISIEKILKLKKEFFAYQEFIEKCKEYFETPLEEVLKSGEKLHKAFNEIKKQKEELVKANLRLIISIARKYAPKGMFLSDLIQEGNIGLLKAVEKFDYRKGFKFSTYATWWIRQNITRYLAENTRTIRIPVHIIETIYKISKIISTKFYREYGREPTLDELSKETGLSIEKLNYIFKVMKQPISLETTIGDEEDNTLRDFIEDQNSLKPDEVTFNTALSEKVREILKTLSPREEKIIRLRFGIGEREPCTLEEVGNKFGVTKERIRQIESIALRKLKHPNRLKLLKNFLIYGS